MELDQEQADALKALARASATRLAARVITSQEMGQLRDSGQAALPFGEFDGSSVRYADRWWRFAPQGWEALDDSAGTRLDTDLERWQAAVAAISEAR
ncbi:hypothetical protein [Streptacidiphilus sp. EB129]|uniref:hypothetical protein n=1 Tax=Streptacidiphilus sp. EB129 TaxID=3156262 RepID=UPI003517694D